jgi:hypothetical protein
MEKKTNSKSINIKRVLGVATFVGLGYLALGNNLENENKHQISETKTSVSSIPIINRPLSWILRENDGNYTLNLPTGRTSYDKVICSTGVTDCGVVIAAAKQLNNIKSEIFNNYAPDLPQEHYGSMRINDFDLDGKVDSITFPPYSSRAPDLNSNKLDLDLIQKGNKLIHLENIVQSYIKYHKNT